MKILITGVSGTGKTTIGKVLKERGYVSFDFSEVAGLCSWRNKLTQEKVDFPENPDISWFNKNGRYCDVQKLENFLNQYEDIFMTGVASGNHEEYFKLFDKVFLLQCPGEISVSRMQNRLTIWDKNQASQDQVVEWKKEFDPKLISLGAITISNEYSLDDVVEKIITLT